MKAIILFDGVCNLCNQSVQFIIKRDPKGYFTFTSIQGETGQKLLQKYQISNNLDSLLLIEDNNYYTKSAAALQICKHLNGFWKYLIIFKIVPPFIRNSVYDIVAKNRYKWFGKRDSCMLPTPENKNRFI
ncbi:thiol-disulfide oxidoreductase DCC family protein [Niallia nealsonii]|uniref:Thiol-disulfide oxidoreductase n=1 Tax=Niallia nealsonii TaxID=115979 RepID=A0A2N0Z7Z2_9BACI|nr:thiol-disulfide oxidoreductase DCC family protein [Niallia nealsonii]PKG25640.1 thiol-disulfide oxidoreductase [Niallia nealsonii]